MCKCLDCHFLSKYRRNLSGNEDMVFSLNKKDRIGLASSNFHIENYSLCCYRKVWDENLSGFEKSNKEKIILKKRCKDDCLFEKYHEDMLFPAAIELSQRKYDTRQSSKALRIASIGLWIAGLSMAISAVVSIIALIKNS